MGRVATTATRKMTAAERRAQILAIAAEEFAIGGLHGTSTEAIARRAEITQAYVFRLFGSKKNLFIQVVTAAFDQLVERMEAAAGDKTGLEALSEMGRTYDELLTDRTALLLQLQGFAAASEPEVRDAVRERFGRMWDMVSATTGLDPVAVKSFLAFGMLLNNGAALQVRETDEPWALGVRTRIQPGLFEHITSETNR
jgi:AcrR family transcriptional regulator